MQSFRRLFSSKTPVKSGLGAVVSGSQLSKGDPFPSSLSVNFPPAGNINLVSEEKRSRSQVPATASIPKDLTRPKFVRRRKEILRMEDSELEGYAILQKRPALIERRGEGQNLYHKVMGEQGKERNFADWFSFAHGDWDLRPVAVKRWWKSLDTEVQIKNQAFNAQRNKVLGNDLAIAHFIVARKGRIRFRGHADWVTQYRKDAKPGLEEEDLPVMKFELCTLPIRYDPRYRVEAIDCGGFPLRYEGLANFQNLNYVKWLSFRDGPHIDDWCLDRLTRIFYDTLEYIDLSGCKQVSERGLGALAKCKNLKTLVVEDMSHIKHLEIIAAMLEDQYPELTVFGVDYAKKTEQIRAEGEEVERKLLEERAALEANTINVEPTPVREDSHSQKDFDRGSSSHLSHKASTST